MASRTLKAASTFPALQSMSIRILYVARLGSASFFISSRILSASVVLPFFPRHVRMQLYAITLGMQPFAFCLSSKPYASSNFPTDPYPIIIVL
uniref:Uncharacterized protein n=1 Tax=Rhizophora mucronata TaxID=61149 RepID=A0A2P2KGP2_RHIMU